MTGMALNIEHEPFHNLKTKDHLMSTNRVGRPSSAKVVPMTTSTTNVSDVLQQYGYGAMPFIGTENSFYSPEAKTACNGPSH